MRKVQELGLMRHSDGKDYRWLCIEADTKSELDLAVHQAAERGWREVPLLRGTATESQRPAIILCKPPEAVVLPS